jgi:head-tail adaptor
MIRAPALPTAGQLREVLDIQANTPSGDGGGGFTQSWAVISGCDDIRAKVVPTTGLERAAAAQVEGGQMFDVWVRYSSATAGVTTADRVVWRSRNLNIRSIRNVDEQQIWLLMVCEERIGKPGMGA